MAGRQWLLCSSAMRRSVMFIIDGVEDISLMAEEVSGFSAAQQCVAL